MSTNLKTEPKRKSVSVQPFAIEVTASCQDVKIQSIPNCILRGRVRSTKKIINILGPGRDITTGPSKVIPGIPDVDGMQLHVSPGTCKVKVVDPLFGDEETLNLIKTLVDAYQGTRTKSKLSGMPTREEKLEPSRMKTLVRELIWWEEEGMVKFIKGTKPEMEDIDNLPGKYLLNPGSMIQNMQPRYEEDFQDWVDGLAKG